MSCREEFPHIDALYRELKDSGLSVIAIDTSNDLQRTREFYVAHNFVIPAAFDTAQLAYGIFGITGTPTHYLLDHQGRIVWRHFGYARGDEMMMREQVLAVLRKAS